jgi:DNA gyrase subunit B
VPTTELVRGEPTDETGIDGHFFWPSEDVFETVNHTFETLSSRFREMAFLNKGLRLTLPRRASRPVHDEDDAPEAVREVSYKYDGGLVDFVNHLNSTKGASHRSVIAFETEDRSARWPSRWPCSGTPASTSRSTPSPTRSTRTRAAPTRRASAPRSPRWSTSSARSGA